jgi:hypothetical protein
MNSKQVASKAAQVLMDFGFIQTFVASKFSAAQYDANKQRVRASLEEAIQRALDSESKVSSMEDKVRVYLGKLVEELSARGVKTLISKDGRTLSIVSPKKSSVPILRLHRDQHNGEFSGCFVFNFISSDSGGIIPFLRSSSNLEEINRDANLIQQNFPKLFEKKAPKRGTTRKSKD